MQVLRRCIYKVGIGADLICLVLRPLWPQPPTHPRSALHVAKSDSKWNGERLKKNLKLLNLIKIKLLNFIILFKNYQLGKQYND